MRDQLSERLETLKGDFERGRARLAELEAEDTQLRETMLRVSGAIQVLTEELTRTDGEPAADSPP